MQEKQNLSLTELNVSRLDAIVKILKDTSHYHYGKFADSDVTLLLNLLRSWPIAMAKIEVYRRKRNLTSLLS